MIKYKPSAKLELRKSFGDFSQMSTFGICSLLYNWYNLVEYDLDYKDEPKNLSEKMGYIYVGKPDPVMTILRSPSNDVDLSGPSSDEEECVSNAWYHELINI